MVDEIAAFIAKHRAETFPKQVGNTHKSTTSPAQPNDDQIEDHDKETVKFLNRHKVQKWEDRAGNKNPATTKYSLENEKNSRLKGHGKSKEKSVYESEELKEKKFDNLAKKLTFGGDVDLGQAPNSAKDTGLSPKKKIFKSMAGGGGSLGALQGTYSQRARASRNIKEEVCSKCHKEECECGKKKLLIGGNKLKENTLANEIAMFILEHNKAARLEKMLEGVGEIHKVNMDHPDFTGGMHIGEKPDAENQTEHKPTVGSSAKTKKISKAQKSEVKVMEDHCDSIPHLDGSKLPPKNKIPSVKKDPNQPQPELGDPNKKKRYK